MLTVKKVKIAGLDVWGITNGKKWFFWAYEVKETAEKVMDNITTQMEIQVNVCYDRPTEISKLQPSGVKKKT